MAWITAVKHRTGNGSNYGIIWEKYPAIRITKGSIYLNEKFQECFDVHVGTMICVMCDRDNGGLVGIKKWTEDDDPNHAYPACQSAPSPKTKSRTKNLRINCAMPSKVFPDRIGDVFRARLNHGERVIEASLTERE